MWADALNHQVRRCGFKSFWQPYLWHFRIVEAVSLLTLFTIEVRMLVIIMFVAVAVAEFIPRAIAVAFNRMDQMVLIDHHNAVGCGLDMVLFEQFDTGRFVHSDVLYIFLATKLRNN